MVDFKSKYPEKYSILTDEYVDDTEKLNAEIIAAVENHSLIDRKKVVFYTNPTSLIEDIVRQPDKVIGVLNFCDDHMDRIEFWHLPSVFEIYKIPYSGSTINGSFLTHNKFHAFAVAKNLNVPVPESQLVTKYNIKDINVKNFPVLVKPNNEGGSEGVNFRSVVTDPSQLQEVLLEMQPQYEELIINEYLPGDEMTIGILRHGDRLIPLTVKVIQFKNFGSDPTIYTDDFKWDETLLNARQLIVKPFDGDPAVKDRVVQDSIKLFYNFECRDFARIDWKCDANGVPKFIDFNESPMYGKDASFLWCLEQMNMSCQDLFTAIIDNLLHAMNYNMVPIGDFWVRKDVLALHWNCDSSSCGRECCREGCYFVRSEKEKVEEHIVPIMEYLKERSELPFYDPEPLVEWKYSAYENPIEWFSTKTIDGRCFFQALDGRCAIQAYCIDHGLPSGNFMFSRCRTWPLNIEMINSQWQITLHHEFYDTEWNSCPCIRSQTLPLEKQMELPHVVESLKDAIIGRIGVERLEILIDYLRNNTQYLPESSKEKQEAQTTVSSSVESQ